MILFPSFIALLHRIYLNPIQVKVFTENWGCKRIEEERYGAAKIHL
jgi:hypothetical protein